MSGRAHATRVFLTLWVIVVFYADPLLEISTVRSLYLARAIVEDRSFVVDRFAHASKGDLAVHDGHYYCGSMPGLGLAATPIAMIGNFLSSLSPIPQTQLLQILAILFFNAPLAAYTALLLARLFEDLGVEPVRRWILASGAILGTHFLFFTTKFFEYPLLFFAQVVLMRALLGEERASRPARALLVGGILGLSYIVNDLAFLLNAMMVVFCCRFRPEGKWVRQLALVALGALPCIAARIVYMKASFGSFTASPYEYSASSGTIIDIYEQYPSLLHVFGRALALSPRITFDLTFGPRGLFVFAPIFFLLFALIRRRHGYLMPRLAVGCALVAAANFCFHFSLIDGIWMSGASWGPRYMLFSLGPLMVLLALASRTIERSTLALLAGVSAFFTQIGVQYGYSDNLLHNAGLFLIGGPTTPAFRYVWLHWSIVPTPERIALVLEETPRISAYYAFTHPSPFFAFIILAAVLAMIWLPAYRVAQSPAR